MCEQFSAHLNQPTRLSAFAVNGAKTDGGMERLLDIDFDSDGIEDSVIRFCPNSASIIPADPCTLEAKSSLTGEEFAFEEQRFYVIKFKSLFYVVAGRVNDESGPAATDIYLLTSAGTRRICSYECSLKDEVRRCFRRSRMTEDWRREFLAKVESKELGWREELQPMRIQMMAGVLIGALSLGNVQATEWPQKYADCVARMPANQLEINKCARLEYLELDRELNSVYQRLLKIDPNASALRDAQRAWLVFRNKVCLYDQAYVQPGGSAAGMYYQDCLTRHTKRRIEDLKRDLQKYEH